MEASEALSIDLSTVLLPQPSELHFRILAEKLPAGVYTCDADGLITYFNEQAVRLWGRTPKLNDPADRFCGSFKLLAVDGSPIPHEECWMALSLKHQREYNGYEIVVERPDGRRHTVLAHTNPIHDEDGKFLGAVNVLVDITERKQVESALRETNELLRANVELEERNRALEQFAYVASHDLQEPLRMITSYLQLLERRYESQIDETGHAYIGHAVDGAQRLHELIRDLLAYSRVGTSNRSFETVDMHDVVKAMLKDLQEATDEAEAVIDVGCLPMITGDPIQIRRLLQNLVANAIKFRRADARPHIAIRARISEDESDAWVFSVADDGIGLDMEYAGQVFDVFQRLHPREQYQGTGIGLAICKRIVERHGGRIWVESEPARGATFAFTLPASAAPSARLTPS